MVKHMLRCQMQHHIALIGSLDFLENLPKMLRRIGDILHYVRGHPYDPHTLYLVYRQQADTLVKAFHTVIHSGEKVAVPVSITLQDS